MGRQIKPKKNVSQLGNHELPEQLQCCLACNLCSLWTLTWGVNSNRPKDIPSLVVLTVALSKSLQHLSWVPSCNEVSEKAITCHFPTHQKKKKKLSDPLLVRLMEAFVMFLHSFIHIFPLISILFPAWSESSKGGRRMNLGLPHDEQAFIVKFWLVLQL